MNDLLLWLTLHKATVLIQFVGHVKACIPASTEEPVLKYGQQRTTVECPFFEVPVSQR